MSRVQLEVIVPTPGSTLPSSSGFAPVRTPGWRPRHTGRLSCSSLSLLCPRPPAPLLESRGCCSSSCQMLRRMVTPRVLAARWQGELIPHVCKLLATPFEVFKISAFSEACAECWGCGGLTLCGAVWKAGGSISDFLSGLSSGGNRDTRAGRSKNLWSALSKGSASGQPGEGHFRPSDCRPFLSGPGPAEPGKDFSSKSLQRLIDSQFQSPRAASSLPLFKFRHSAAAEKGRLPEHAGRPGGSCAHIHSCLSRTLLR